MIKLLSRLPWALLYAFSAFLYFLAYYIVHHRQHVIREQLDKVFPALSAAQKGWVPLTRAKSRVSGVTQI